MQEGEVNLLGGLIQRTLTNQVQGIPGLGDIPGLRYLFSQENKEVNDQEVLVMLTPRVIRLPEPACDRGLQSSQWAPLAAVRNALEASRAHVPSRPPSTRAPAALMMELKMVKRRNQFSDKAFMLIELIAAITILLVLTTLALPLARNEIIRNRETLTPRGLAHDARGD